MLTERDCKRGMKKKKQIVYYTDEMNDEFSTAKIKPKRIDETYVYIRSSVLAKLAHIVLYRMIATPSALLFLKLRFHHRIKNKKILKAYRKKAFFLYGNHTQAIADALIPSAISFPKSAYVIAHPNNVSMPFLGRLTPALGALPLPDTLRANRNFLQAVEQRLKEKSVIAVYPEAHIWPYYTGIRPFSDKSFFYPVKYKTPVFCFTNTYEKRRFGKRPKIVTYVDGPFFPQKERSFPEQRAELRECVYRCMLGRSRCSNVAYIEYRRKRAAHD